MEDPKLLDLAAKAAGLNDCWFDEFHDDYVVYHQDIDCNCSWNPLEDDGDALRLAVKLNMQVTSDAFNGDTEILYNHMPLDNVQILHEDHGDDPCAATRRAIVRAAASIGEQMK